MKKVAWIGSSGGGAATLGHYNVQSFLDEILQKELESVDLTVSHVVFVRCPRPLDGANRSTTLVELWEYHNGALHCTKTGPLNDINDYIRGTLDAQLANQVEQLDAVICTSCRPDLFAAFFRAVSSHKLPVTGSGGSSLSQLAQSFELQIVGNAGGSVAGTNYTRALSYTYSLAAHFGKSYRPYQAAFNHSSLANMVSVWNASLGIFWAACLLKWTVTVAGEHWNLLDAGTATAVAEGIERWLLPVACSVIIATSSSEEEKSNLIPTSSLVFGSVLACLVCSGSAVSGLLAGFLVQQLTKRVLFWCVVLNIPTTMTNLLSGTLTGSVALIVMRPLVSTISWLTANIRYAIEWSVSESGSLFSDDEVLQKTIHFAVAFLVGVLCCYGSKQGWYHKYFLPLIIVEMERGDASFLGAVDELSLVLVCAGICAACYSQNALHRRGLLVNMLCGDFVEVCYPVMEKHRSVNVAGYLASGLSCGCLVVLGNDVPKSLAYLPLPVSIFLAQKDWLAMAVACSVAFVIPFLVTTVALVSKRKGD